MADSITPDELRLTLEGKQLSKELLRQYYKNEDREFCHAIKHAKGLSMDSHRSLRNLMHKRFWIRPRALDREFLDTIEQLYRSLAKRITTLDIFGKTVELQELLHILDRWGVCD